MYPNDILTEILLYLEIYDVIDVMSSISEKYCGTPNPYRKIISKLKIDIYGWFDENTFQKINKLTDCQYINMSYSDVSDLSCISGLYNLKYLNLEDCKYIYHPNH